VHRRRVVRDTAAFFREAERVHRNPKLSPIGDITHAGKPRLRIAVCTESIVRDATPEFRELTMKTAALLEELGHKVTEIRNPVPERLRDDFLCYWQSVSFAIVRGGRRMIGPSFDPSKFDNLTMGLHHDAVLMPTLADETPPIGHLSPMAPYEQVMDRPLNWVTFTPAAERHRRSGHLASARGIRGGYAGRHDAVHGQRPRGQAARIGLRTRRGAAVAAHQRLTRNEIRCGVDTTP
jgi:hypothetical protein